MLTLDYSGIFIRLEPSNSSVDIESTKLRIHSIDELVDCLRKEIKKYTGSRVYGYHIFPDVWRLFHEHVFEQKSEEKKLPFVLVELATSLDEADLSKASQNVEECFELFKKIHSFPTKGPTKK